MTLQEYNDIYKMPVLKSVTITSSGGVTITNTNIVSEKMSLEKSLCSEDNLRYGRCEAACFKITIADISHDFTGEWLNVVLDVQTDDKGYLITEDGLYLLTEDGKKILLSDEERIEVQAVLGRFKVISDKPTNDRRWRELTCYDAMRDILNADVAAWYNSLTFPMTIKDLRDSFFAYLGITQETVTLVNDSFVTQGGFSVVGTLSGKTVIEAICEFNGVFGQITPSGTFDYVSLVDAETLTLDYYVDGTGTYEDYVTDYITGINARGTESDVGTFVGLDTNVYVLEGNPLIYGTEGSQALQTALGNLLTQIGSDSFRPFSVQTYGNPMLPLGTRLTIATRDKAIVSNVINKVMTGIQGLRDKYEAKSEKHQPALVNNARSDITRTKGKVYELEIDVDGLTSRVASTETTVSGHTVAISNAQSAITQNTNSINTMVQANYVTHATYDAEIQNLQDQIDGHIEYYDGNYVPTLNNAPASNWTTETEKNRHLGDLFRYKHGTPEVTDYYRFDKDTTVTPNVFSWVLLGAGDIDEALRKADEANAKADAAQTQLDALQDDIDDNYSTTAQMQSAINQTAQSIVSTVSSSQNKYDESKLPSGVTISEYGYGAPTSDPTEHSGEYYLDNTTGQVYSSDGTAWSVSGNPLPLLTDGIAINSTSIAQLADKYVIKVASGGKLVEVKLSADPVGADFKIKADNIDFIADNEIKLTTKNLGIKSTNFEVTSAGEITSKLGTIGGWTIGANALTSVYSSSNNRYEVGMKSFTGSDLTREAFYVRSSTNGGSSWTNQFYVRWNGQLFARNADITGTISTNNITATGGTIGAINIGANGLYSEYVNGNTKYRMYIDKATTDPAKNCFVIRHTTDNGASYTYPFVLKYDGSLTATKATITGSITTTSLKIDNKANLSVALRSISSYDFTISTTSATVTGDAIQANVLQISSGYGMYIPNAVEIGGYLFTNELSVGKLYARGQALFNGNVRTQGWLSAAGNIYANGVLSATGQVQSGEGIELGLASAAANAYIDFHYNSNNTDYTYRVWQRGVNTLDFIGQNSSTWGTLRAASFAVQSSRRVKTNIQDIPDEEAKKILQLEPVSFDYKNGQKNQRGLIAEDVLKVLPEMVNIPEEYDPNNEEDMLNVPNIDYAKFVPYLIKMIQMQQKQIDSLMKLK